MCNLWSSTLDHRDKVEKSDWTLLWRLQDLKSVELKPVPRVQAVTPSELTPETKLQRGQSVEFITRPVCQDTKSLGFNSALQLQDRKLSMLTQGANHQGVKSMEFNPEENLQGTGSPALKKLHIMNFTDVSHDPEF